MDSEQVNNLINNIVTGVTAVGSAAGSIYSSFKTPSATGATTTTTNNYYSSSNDENKFPWLPVGIGVGLLGLILILNK